MYLQIPVLPKIGQNNLKTSMLLSARDWVENSLPDNSLVIHKKKKKKPYEYISLLVQFRVNTNIEWG
jgi:hypothetical protein